ncbi:5'/3'-nucleotidase SurE [Nocardia vaccinii]|uniref:5'/3'-nucleotidase SurE n=1 Tax=Nocardia vaccinii TaxID=1822 RepID=UPI000A42B6B8
MRILVSNDDGIGAAGLSSLAGAVVNSGHEVVIVAPNGEFSGSAASLGVVRDETAVGVTAGPFEHLAGVEAYAVDAPPGLGVRAACLGMFGPCPELVVSGINPGYNSGRLVLHSGTVGAALTAASMDVCGVAFSTGSASMIGLRAAARVVECVIPALIDIGLPPVVVNVNVPALPIDEIVGVAYGQPGAVGADDLGFEFHGPSLHLRRRFNPPPYDPGSDTDLLSRGLVAVSVLGLPWITPDVTEQIAAAVESQWKLLERVR